MKATRPCPWSLADAESPEFLAEQPVRAIAATAAPAASVRSIGDGLDIAGASWASGENGRFRTWGGAASGRGSRGAERWPTVTRIRRVVQTYFGLNLYGNTARRQETGVVQMVW